MGVNYPLPTVVGCLLGGTLLDSLVSVGYRPLDDGILGDLRFQGPARAFHHYIAKLSPRLLAFLVLIALVVPFWVGLEIVPTTSRAVPVTSPYAWTSPVQIDKLAFSAISCPLTVSCTAVDRDGNSYSYNGSTWTLNTTATVPAGFNSITCPNTTNCLATDQAGDNIVEASGTWGSPYLVSTTSSLTSISCGTGTNCVIVDNAGNDYTSTNTGSIWSSFTNIDGTNSINSVSCSGTSCAAVDSAGNALFSTNSGTSWTTLNIDATTDLTAVSCSSSTTCMAVDKIGNAFETTNSGTSWTAFSSIDAGHDITSVSCPSTKCFAVDSSGRAMAFNGAVWSAPLSIDGTTPLESISCAGNALPITFACFAVDQDGQVIAYNNTATWSSPVVADPGTNPVNAVSCASATSCVAVDQVGNSATYTSGSWAPINGFDPGHQATSISCVSATTFCAASDGSGNMFTSTNSGTSWTEFSGADGTRHVYSVSCVSSSFCVAVDSLGNAVVYNGSTWTGSSIDAGHHLTSVSCPSTTLCVAIDQSGNAFEYNGSTWSTGTWSNPVDSGHSLSSVSCFSSSFCMAVDGSDDYLTFNATTWSARQPVETIAPNGISCTSSSFCMAVDAVGNAFSYKGSSWSVPVVIDSGHALEAVSCVSGSFCAAVDGVGNALTYNGSTWSSPLSVDGSNQLHSISCVSASFCVAVDQVGNAVEFNGTNWTSQPWSNPIDSTTPIYSVSCVSIAFCVAVDNIGHVLTYSGGSSWSNSAIDSSNLLSSVSCTSASFCIAVDNAGNYLEWNGSSWTSPVSIGTSGLGQVSCTSPSFCVTTDGTTDSYYFTGETWIVEPFGGSIPPFNYVSCVSGEFCGATYMAGVTVVRTDSFGWSSSGTIDVGSPTAISCPSSTICMATDGTGDVLTSSNPSGGFSAWSIQQNVTSGFPLPGASCPSTTFCIAVGGRNAYWENPSATSPSVTSENITGVGRLTGISCPSVSLCVAIDNSGDVVISTTPTIYTSWTLINVDSTFQINDISCDPSGAICMLSDVAGNIIVGTNISQELVTNWSTPTPISGFSFPVYVTCPSSSLCLAVDGPGSLSYSTNPTSATPTWSSPAVVDPGTSGVSGITCSSTTSCVIEDLSGNVVTSQNPEGGPSAWVVVNIDGPSGNLAGISCPNPNYCAVVDSTGNLFIGTVTPPPPPPPTTTYSLSLVASQTTASPGGTVTITGTLDETTTNSSTGVVTTVAVSGASLSFDVSSGPDGGATSSVSTNSLGVGTFVLKNSGTPGIDLVTGGYITPSGTSTIASTQVNFEALDTLVLTPTSQGADVGGSSQTTTNTSATISALASNPSGAPLIGITVVFSVTGGPDSGLGTSARTNSNGVATFSLSATKAGADTISATLTDPVSTTSVTSNTATIVWAAPIDPVTSFPGSTTKNPTGHSVTLSITLTSPLSALLRGVSLPKTSGSFVADVGVPVVFSVTAGPNSGKSSTQTTNSSGTASWTYSSSAPGTDTVEASYVDSAGLSHVVSTNVVWASPTTTTLASTTTVASTTTAASTTTLGSTTTVASPTLFTAPPATFSQGQVSQTQVSQAPVFTSPTSTPSSAQTTIASPTSSPKVSDNVNNHLLKSSPSSKVYESLGLTPSSPQVLDGNLATKKTVKALVAAGLRGPDMSFNKGYGIGAQGGPPGLVPLAQSVPSPTEAFHDFRKTAGGNAILTFILIFLIGLPSLIFNSTLKEHHANLASSRGAIKRAIDRVEAWLARLSTWSLLGVFSIIGSLLYSIVDPTFGFNLSSLAEIVGYVGAIIVSTSITELARGLYVHRKFKKIGDLKAFPLGIVMALVFDVFSRVAHFEPGFVFGVLAALVFRVEPTGEEDGRSVTLSSLWLMGASALCWVIWIPVKDNLIGGNHNFVILCADALLSFIWICGLQSLFFGLIPIKSMDGDTVFKWSKAAWASIYVVVTFVFVQFIIHPSAAGYGGNSKTSIVPLLAMFVAATVAAGIFWIYTKAKWGNKTKGEPEKVGIEG